MKKTKHNWSEKEIKAIHNLPLISLISRAHKIHCRYHDPQEIQTCSLISVKTGGCPENCKYCAQSSYYQTPVQAQKMLSVDEVLEIAKKAIQRGATRICLGAAWREVRDNMQFDQILKMIEALTKMDVEVCCTLGMLKEHQAARLAQAGLYAYNHNLDTSENFYKNIVTTRTYKERLDTLKIIRKADISVCCGGIIGLGETIEDRLNLLHTLAMLDPHPESVPINILGPVKGTPLENEPKVTAWEMIRMIATTRIIMPSSMIRLSAGRLEFSFEQQALCFFAGANSIFSGEKLLTIPNSPLEDDEKLFHILGLKKRPSFAYKHTRTTI